MPSHFKFKEYCPLVFRNLRERFDVDDDMYLNSLTKFCPIDSDSPGRSGARFLASWDQKFVVKTLMSEEVAEMHRIMKEYHQV
jgi:1-phosphatidylinositol-5-phosphate 4-kinase